MSHLFWRLPRSGRAILIRTGLKFSSFIIAGKHVCCYCWLAVAFEIAVLVVDLLVFAARDATAFAAAGRTRREEAQNRIEGSNPGPVGRRAPPACTLLGRLTKHKSCKLACSGYL